MEEVPRVRCGYIEDLVDTKLFATMPPPQLQEVHRDAAVFAPRSFVAGLPILAFGAIRDGLMS
jgi:hypothetical protein